MLFFAHLAGFGVAGYLLAPLPTGAWLMAAVVISDLAIMGFFASAVLGAPLLRGLLGWKPLSFIGLVSYSMFLLHQTVLLFASEWVLRAEWLVGFAGRGGLAMAASFFAFVLLFFAVTVSISWFSFRFVESPFVRMKPN